MIVKRTHQEAGGDKELIARMEIKDHKQTFLDRPPDNKIDLYIEKNLKVHENQQDVQRWQKKKLLISRKTSFKAIFESTNSVL